MKVNNVFFFKQLRKLSLSEVPSSNVRRMNEET